jgi:hypothetical protein
MVEDASSLYWTLSWLSEGESRRAFALYIASVANVADDIDELHDAATVLEGFLKPKTGDSTEKVKHLRPVPDQPA